MDLSREETVVERMDGNESGSVLTVHHTYSTPIKAGPTMKWSCAVIVALPPIFFLG